MRRVGGIWFLSVGFVLSLATGCDSSHTTSSDTFVNHIGIDTGNAIDFSLESLLIQVDGEDAGLEIEVDLDSFLGCRVDYMGDSEGVQIDLYLDVYRSNGLSLFQSFDVTDFDIQAAELEEGNNGLSAIVNNFRFRTQCRAEVLRSGETEPQTYLSEMSELSLFSEQNSGNDQGPSGVSGGVGELPY